MELRPPDACEFEMSPSARLVCQQQQQYNNTTIQQQFTARERQQRQQQHDPLHWRR